jgi:hypothetical protein
VNIVGRYIGGSLVGRRKMEGNILNSKPGVVEVRVFSK